MNIRLMRGQVVVREELNADTAHLTHIIVPGVSNSDLNDAIDRNRTWHRGKVLAMGPPSRTRKGRAEVPHGFVVGDTVLFHWEHHEKSFTREWIDGEPAAWLSQRCIDAVCE